MNRKEAKEIIQQLSIVKAFAEGKEVQWLDNGKWVTTHAPSFSLGCTYRIKPEVKVGYINVYPFGLITNRTKTSRVEADDVADSDRIACIRIEYEEGQFDE